MSKYSAFPLSAVLQQLANDANEWVRLGVARNPNTPLDVLANLVRDRSYDVREVALKAFQARQ
jgi:hypothetical protein